MGTLVDLRAMGRRQWKSGNTFFWLLVCVVVGFVFLFLPWVTRNPNLEAIDAYEYERLQSKMKSGTWLVAYYMPTKDQQRWANEIVQPAFLELQDAAIDIHLVAVQTRPEVRDFGRHFNILEWPFVEVVHDSYVYPMTFPNGNKNNAGAIVDFGAFGWQDAPKTFRSDLRRTAVPLQ